ncbi:MAG: hypothetical protein IPL19_24870 [Sandaracinaceae bacterium]|jgi:hypothetical protein|nr:hypothetical protein [Sandaracinaceae bacterium]MBK7773510.1 hypothetical protein [Sandaracinaceae bacterium]MBK8411185.1 hypothetical protein [Sandaracinaceae bacterium]MBK8589023.1 hypothetical protein [Sandaracinaceae bacterium]
MTIRHLLLTLAMCAATLFPGCGGGDAPLDSGPADQAVSTTCAVNNGGCSISPMVLCGLSGTGQVLCAACPTGYVGDGRVCTSSGPVDECTLGTDNCSPNAICTDTVAAFMCECAGGFNGNGVVCEHVACEDVGDCDDAVACTVDSCSASGSCLHTPTSSLCADNGVCHPTRGCLVGSICGSPSECVDSDPCTRDEMCDAASATCVFAPLDNDEDGEVPLVCGGTDCNDAVSQVGAGKNERCGNGVDDDCNGVVDSDATVSSDPTLRSSETNCGGCGNACAQGDTCYQGVCVACGTTGAPCCNTTCESATSCFGGTCSNGGSCLRAGGTATCTAPCGDIGEICCAGSTCGWAQTCDAGNICRDASFCADAGTAVLYRLNSLDIPTPDQAAAGDIVGHNVDRAGDTCGVPDYDGGVDNSLIDLAAALPALAPDDPMDLQAEIDTALNCPAASVDCTRMDLIVSVRTGTGCVIMEIEDGNGETLAGPFSGTRDGSGNVRGVVSSLNLTIPYGTDTGTVDIDLTITNVIITGNVTANSLSNVVIGGALVQTALETTLMEALATIDGNYSFDDVEPILENLYDIQVGGQCAALSVGFTGAGTLYTP